jgi:putative ABC transport system ATP-binding protein
LRHLLQVARLRTPALVVTDLEVVSGELVGLDAPSGAGSSLLLSLLAGLARPDSGEVRFDGHPLGPDWVQHRALLEQDHLLPPELTVSETVSLQLRVAGASRAEIAETTRYWSSELGISGAAEQLVGQLSGGQQQRVAIARALAGRRPVLLFDDPTAELDADNRAVVIRLVREQVAGGALVVAASHDPDLLGVADAVATITDGELRVAG